MLLSRVTPNPFEDHIYSPEGRFSGLYEYNYTASAPYAVDKEWGQKEWRVSTRFERFGGGKHRRSDYAVSVTWEDVERIIEALCEAGCPEALPLREARKLATAVKDLGWQAPDVATAEARAA
jgi:hypothetical protein